jgi:hypothetical protein
MKIYIAGKITGEKQGDVFEKFNAAAYRIRRKGHEVVNPLDFCKQNWSWEQCMKVCIEQLITCDAIFMLPDWSRSNGARLEHEVATGLGLAIYRKINEL